MSTFGLYGEFPWTFGGEESAVEVEHMAMLDALAPGWDVEEPGHDAECFAHAAIVSVIWAVNERQRNQALPMRMLESLTDWEGTLKLRPTARDYAQDRRSRVAARLRGLVNNALGDISDSCLAIFGDNFDQIVVVEPSSEVVYWPGVNPGPPGFEWSTNRCRIGVRVTKVGLSTVDFATKREALAETLDAIVPGWMTFCIGVGSSFIVNQGIIGQTFL